MIKNNESIIKITNKNKKYYTNKGYDCKIDEVISISISELSDMSHNLVVAICDICYTERELPLSKYNQNYKRQNFYSCKKCSSIKNKKTNLEKYGVEYISQREDIKENQRSWMKSDDFKRKSKETQMARYGSLYTKTQQFKIDISKKQIDIIRDKKSKGEYSTFLSSPENNELKKKGMFEKYGASFSFYVPEIKYKIQNSNLDRFGHISPFGNDHVVESAKQTMIIRYGVDNPFKNKAIQEKIKLKVIEKFNGVDRNDFLIYRNKIRNETYKIKDCLFESWDGYDYYDGEYIKDNLALNKNDNNYPSIDHKISCIYGYRNNINAENISDISNLCITKRIINSKKSQLNEYEFIKIINLVM